jgi:hypothetical protein
MAKKKERPNGNAPRRKIRFSIVVEIVIDGVKKRSGSLGEFLGKAIGGS